MSLADAIPGQAHDSITFYKQIAFTAYCFDKAGMHRVIANFGTNSGYPYIDRPVLTVVFDATQLGKYLFPAQDTTRIGAEQPQKVELGAGQLNAFLIQPGFAHRIIDNQRTKRQATGILFLLFFSRRSKARIRASKTLGRTGLAT